jgi:hypothetical protein
MTLGELITALEAEDPERRLPLGFGNAHSYRGFYEDLAFEPVADVTTGEMLAEARKALGQTFQGWKGGDFAMHEYTDCWLAVHGRTGEGIGPVLLSLLLAAGELGAPAKAKLAALAQPRWRKPPKETADAD